MNTNARKPSPPTDRDALDLLPRNVGLKLTDDLLRTMLSSPPDPHVTPKPKSKTKRSPNK